MTVAKLIHIQGEQLCDWEEILKPNVYKDLLTWVAMQNKKIVTANDVVRGSRLNYFIENWLHHRSSLLADKM